jgi:hypothetical protein
MLIVRHRGAGWATAGGAVLILGAAMQATGAAGWAMLCYFTSGPALDPATATAFMARIASDSRLFTVPVAAAAVDLGWYAWRRTA